MYVLASFQAAGRYVFKRIEGFPTWYYVEIWAYVAQLGCQRLSAYEGVNEVLTAVRLTLPAVAENVPSVALRIKVDEEDMPTGCGG